MIELANLRKLHTGARKRIKVLENENKELKAEVKELRVMVQNLTGIVEKLQVRNEELLHMTFGKKAKKRNKDNDPKPPKVTRTKDSYTRPIPGPDEITETKHHKLSICGCGHDFSKKQEKEYYEEDIILPEKKVIRHTVEQGYCSPCRKWSSAAELPCSKVILGETIRTYICYSNIVLRLSYSQIREHLTEMFHLSVSDGEIAKILLRKSEYHEDDYEDLKKMIQKEPVVHMDETTDFVRDGDGYKAYTWLVQGRNTPELVFSKGRNRGGGNVPDLLGESTAVGVTDDYGAYKNAFSSHQLCFAHLHRKLRDLAESSVLSGEVLTHCKEVFALESDIYSKVRSLANRDDLTGRQRKLWTTKLTKELNALSVVHVLDPSKLRTYKKTLAGNISKYLTCIRIPNVPCDNNQAERSIRHIVLKRKTSFGHISAKGAKTASILNSVLMTARNRMKLSGRGFFEEYVELGV